MLRTLRRFGYDPDDPSDGVLNSLQPDGPVLGHNVAFFAETLDDLERLRPDIYASLGSNRFRALAIIPLVVSDHTIGAVVVHWDVDREISEPDRSFLFTITGAGAQAVERARLTLTEFVNLERSQHLHQLSSALAAATTPGDVAHAAIAGGRRALGAQSAVVRVPATGERGLACLASSGHPALLSRTVVPLGRDQRRQMLLAGPDRHRHHRGRRGGSRCGGGSRARAAGAARAAQAGHGRERAARREHRPPRRPVARLRRPARAERARPALPLHAGGAHRTGAGTGPGVRARAGGPTRRRGGARAPVPSLRGDPAPELEPRTHHGDPPDHEPCRGTAGRLLLGAGARRQRSRPPRRPRAEVVRAQPLRRPPTTSSASAPTRRPPSPSAPAGPSWHPSKPARTEPIHRVLPRRWPSR